MNDRKRTAAVIMAIVGICCICSASAEETLRNTAFDVFDEKGKPEAWSINGAYRIAKGEGHNGSGGLVWNSESPCGKLHCARQEISGLNPGDMLTISALVRKENFKCKSHQGAVMSVEWRDKDGKWIRALYAVTKNVLDGEWTPITASGRMPDNARSATMVIYVSGDSSGKVQWDNIQAKKDGMEPVLFVASTTYAATAADGKTRFNAAIRIPNDVKGKIKAFFQWTDASGNSSRRKADEITDRHATIELDVKSLALGRNNIICEVFADDKMLGAATNVFTRVERMPERKVWIDGHGRCIVNGQPFFPLGLYWNPRKDEIDIYTNSPFNCVIHYEMMDRRRLDFCHRHGLMTLNAFDKKLVNCMSGRINKPYSPEDARAEFIKRVKSVKDHPALLAWYIGDELPASLVPRQRMIYDLVKQIDDQHPVYGVQDRCYDLCEFTPTLDVVGLDPYPVCSKPLSYVTDMMRKGREVMFDMRPHWSVPQAFSWQWYREDHQNTERFPSFAEMRSMVWQHIANGANGIISFAFHCLFYPSNRQDWRPRWEITKAVHAEVKKMTPVLLSVDSAPKAKIETGNAVCRTWMKNGKLYLLVCSLSNIPTDVTVSIQSGKWDVQGIEVGTPASMANPSLVSFFMDAYGVSLVCLGPSQTEI